MPFPSVPAPLFNDGDFTTAQPQGLPKSEAPLPNTSTVYLIRQDFVQFAANFTALAFNTAYPIAPYTNFVLVEEGPRTDMGGGLVKWTRTYAKVPDSYSEFESFIYQYVGFIGTWGWQVSISGRATVTLKTMSRVQRDFYLVGPSGSFSDPGGIPTTQTQKYRVNVSGYTSWWLDVEAIGDSPPLNEATSPTRALYTTWIANALASGWSSPNVVSTWGTPGAPVFNAPSGGGQLCAEDTQLSRWKGNIWMATTRFVLAQ